MKNPECRLFFFNYGRACFVPSLGLPDVNVYNLFAITLLMRFIHPISLFSHSCNQFISALGTVDFSVQVSLMSKGHMFQRKRRNWSPNCVGNLWKLINEPHIFCPLSDSADGKTVPSSRYYSTLLMTFEFRVSCFHYKLHFSELIIRLPLNHIQLKMAYHMISQKELQCLSHFSWVLRHPGRLSTDLQIYFREQKIRDSRKKCHSKKKIHICGMVSS